MIRIQFVQETISPEAVEKVITLADGKMPLLASAHAFEKTGVNAIPEALADELAERTGFPVDGSIVQINVVGHTGAIGFSRMARQARFGHGFDRLTESEARYLERTKDADTIRNRITETE